MNSNTKKRNDDATNLNTIISESSINISGGDPGVVVVVVVGGG